MSFSELTGQDSAVQFLRNCVQKLKISQACLFFGPEGTGRYKAALIFAKALNCALPKNSDPCGSCISCLKIDGGTHPDLVTIKPAGAFIKREQIKSLQKNLVYKPLEARYRVVIIQNAGAMNRESSNCLLKTLEEPPAQSLIILLANSPEELLPTIVSRCHLIRFRPLSRSEVLKQMKEIKNRNEAEAIASMADGSLRKAAELMDAKILKMRADIFSALAGLEQGQTASALQLAELIAGQKELCVDLVRFIKSLLRDVLFLKNGTEEELIINSDHTQDLKRCAHSWNQENILASWDLLNKMEETSTRNYNRQLIMENCFLNLIG